MGFTNWAAQTHSLCLILGIPKPSPHHSWEQFKAAFDTTRYPTKTDTNDEKMCNMYIYIYICFSCLLGSLTWFGHWCRWASPPPRLNLVKHLQCRILRDWLHWCRWALPPPRLNLVKHLQCRILRGWLSQRDACVRRLLWFQSPKRNGEEQRPWREIPRERERSKWQPLLKKKR